LAVFYHRKAVGNLRIEGDIFYGMEGGRLFGKLQNIVMGRGTVLDYVRPEAQAVVDDLNELDNEEYEL